MSKPRTNLTGPGICRNCGEFCPDRVAKSLCPRCYQKIYYAYDPKAYAGRQEKEYQKAQQTVVLSLLRQLNLQNVNESQLRNLVRQCALDLVHRKPVIETALKRKRRRTAKIR